jgi:hypothetical protein
MKATVKLFPDKQTLREFVASPPTLQETLQTESKCPQMIIGMQRENQ